MIAQSAPLAPAFPLHFAERPVFHLRFGAGNNRKTHVQQNRRWKIAPNNSSKPFKGRLFALKMFRS